MGAHPDPGWGGIHPGTQWPRFDWALARRNVNDRAIELLASGRPRLGPGRAPRVRRARCTALAVERASHHFHGRVAPRADGSKRLYARTGPDGRRFEPDVLGGPEGGGLMRVYAEVCPSWLGQAIYRVNREMRRYAPPGVEFVRDPT